MDYSRCFLFLSSSTATSAVAYPSQAVAADPTAVAVAAVSAVVLKAALLPPAVSAATVCWQLLILLGRRNCRLGSTLHHLNPLARTTGSLLWYIHLGLLS